MSDTEFFTPSDGTIATHRESWAEGKFVIGYFGAVGMANHLEYLIEIAKLSSIEKPEILFLIVGDGADLAKIQQLAKKEKLSNIKFFPHSPKAMIKNLMACADAIYISFKKIPVLATGSLNKLFDGLAAGKLIIINFEGWIKQLIESHECGIYTDPEQPSQFLKTLTPYLEDHSLLYNAQLKARELATSQFSRQKLVAQLIEVVESNNT